jgi:stearoyl-CoA desaturase (delta-9 desaturase)
LTYDPNKWCIATWKLLGLASDLRTFSQNEIDKGRLQQEQKRLDGKLSTLDWGKPLHGLPVMEWDEFLEGSRSRALIAVAGLAHDLTDFIDEHPGGKNLISSAIGQDATAMFNGGVYDHSNAARNLLAKYRVGIIRGGGEVEIWRLRSEKRLDKIRDYDYSIVGEEKRARSNGHTKSE